MMQSEKLLQILPPLTETFVIPFLNVKVTNKDKNFSLVGMDYTDDQVEVHLQAGSPQISVQMNDISLHFTWEYDLMSDPELIDEHGKVSITVTDLTASIAGSPIVTYNADSYESTIKVDVDEI